MDDAINNLNLVPDGRLSSQESFEISRSAQDITPSHRRNDDPTRRIQKEPTCFGSRIAQG